MKKFLSLLVQGFLVTSVSFSTIACTNHLSGGSSEESKPPDPIISNIKYYQEKIKVNQTYIADCNEMLAEIKDNKDGYENERDYQSALDEVTAESFQLKSEINEWQYQILLLEKVDKTFSPKQILQGIVIFTNKLANLQKELQLKEKYPEYYSKLELKVIEDKIIEAKALLAMFNSLKEEK